MNLKFDPSGLKKTKPWEYAIRFVFGGLITVATGLIGKKWGPSVAGLFLAFPSILPATLTLVKQHDGRPDAHETCHGAVLGSIALLAFSALVWLLSGRVTAPLVLAIALFGWALGAFTLWAVVYHNSDGESVK